MEKTVLFSIEEEIPSGPEEVLSFRERNTLTTSSSVHSIEDSVGWKERLEPRDGTERGGVLKQLEK